MRLARSGSSIGAKPEDMRWIFIMFSVSQIPPVFFMRLAPWFFLFSVVLLVLTYFYGTEIKGSKRWLKIPERISFQPSGADEVSFAESCTCPLFSRSTFASETEIYFLGYRDDFSTSNFDRSAA